MTVQRVFLIGAAMVTAALVATAALSAPQQASPDLTPADLKGKALVEHDCVGCHDLGVITSTGRSAKNWSDVVDRMADRGIEASDAELDQIKAYLAKTQPDTPAGSSPAASPAA
jgi:mono/diheme cytochrome c family protein